MHVPGLAHTLGMDKASVQEIPIRYGAGEDGLYLLIEDLFVGQLLPVLRHAWLAIVAIQDSRTNLGVEYIYLLVSQ